MYEGVITQGEGAVKLENLYPTGQLGFVSTGKIRKKSTITPKFKEVFKNYMDEFKAGKEPVVEGKVFKAGRFYSDLGPTYETILKDSSNVNNIQIIIAKEGKIINENDEKFLFLYDGKIINSSPTDKGDTTSAKKSTLFNFKETRFNLNKYKTKTTTTPKIQELNSFEIIDCLMNINKGTKLEYDNFECRENLLKELSQELYKRMYLPLYIPLISIVVSFLILNSHNHFSYKKTKLITFLIGILFIILSQISVNFISDKIYLNYLIILVLPIAMILSIYLFNIKTKFSS